jgi:pimeloyl-ACP methyl ester carboxylesterase
VPGPIDIPFDQFVILDGVRFHYLDWGGEGDPLLLLAGLGCTAHVFAELAPHLSDRFRVLALTRRGHGLTDQVQSGHALADAAEDARRLLDALGIERAHVVGHSMGGGEVSALAARHPGRVARIVYLDGAYDWADSPTPEWPEEAASPDRFASYEDYVDFVHSLLPDDIRGPALEAMLRTSVDTHADGSVVDKFSDAAAAPFVQALKEFRHPYSDITAPHWPSSPSGTSGRGPRRRGGSPVVTASQQRRRMLTSSSSAAATICSSTAVTTFSRRCGSSSRSPPPRPRSSEPLHLARRHVTK